MAETTTPPADYLGLRTDDYTRHGIVGQQVEWVAWDSPATALEVGDVIVGVRSPDRSLTGSEIPRQAYPPGGSSALWGALDVEPGTPLVFSVHTGPTPEDRTVTGIAQSFYQSADGNRALFPGGPYSGSRGDFSESWQVWYERIIKAWSRLLCEGWRPRSFKSRPAHESHAVERARIDFLLREHPGPFADHMGRAWERVEQVVRGRTWAPDQIDLSYRAYAAERRDQIRAVARAAHDAYAGTQADALQEAFPAPDPYAADPESVDGTLIVIDRVSPRDMRNDGHEAWYILGDRRQGHYFLDAHSIEVRRLGDAILAYQRQVTLHLGESYRFYLRVHGEPLIRAKGSREVALGFKTQLLAAFVGSEMFVSELETETPRMAGREILTPSDLPDPPDDATPRDLAARRIEAAKFLREDVWGALFCEWSVSSDFSANRILLPYGPGSSQRRSGWEQTQRRLTKDVVDVRVLDQSPIYTVLSGDARDGTPHVEECEVEVEHVGETDGVYVGFKDAFLSRFWRFQRLDGGPWHLVHPSSL